MPQTDSKCAKCRRAGEKLLLKGERCFGPNCPMVKRPYAPGQHGPNKRRPKISSYGRQLREKQTAKQFSITNSELTSNSRKQNLVLARQTAIYLSCELTNLSLTKIGQNFGNKNHSTILYSYNKFKELLTTKEE